MERYRVVRIEEQMYGCEELPEGAEVCCCLLYTSPSPRDTR